MTFPDMKQGFNKRRFYLICVGLALTVIIAYEPIRHNDFVDYDDDAYIRYNQDVNKGLTSKSVLWAFTDLHCSMWHPLTTLSHILDCQLFGLNPVWHHLMSLMFHIASVLLLFWILTRMTEKVWLSAFVAAAFALHPLNVESVAWAAERKNVLSGFFWMLTIVVYVRYTEHPGIGRLLLVFLVFGLCIMTKPVVVTLPFVLLLLDYWPLERILYSSRDTGAELDFCESEKSGKRKFRPARLVFEKIPLFVLAAVLSIITYVAQRSGDYVASTGELPIKLRFANAVVSYVSYIAKMFYPKHLVIFYLYTAESLKLWEVILCLMVLVGISVGVAYLASRRRYLAVGWLWYLGTLVPVIGLVQVGGQMMADRYAYLPLIGIFIMIAWGLADLFAKWRYRRVGFAIFTGVVLTALCVCTRMQLRHWQNSLTLFGHAAEVTEDNYVMRNYYGWALLEAGRHKEAIAYFDEALRINPRYYDASNYKGRALLELGEIDDAIEILTNVLRLQEDRSDTYGYLGLAYAKKGDIDLAIQNYKEALRIKPDLHSVHNNLACVYYERKMINEAIVHWTEALRINPEFADAHCNLAYALAQLGRIDEAVRHYNEALRIKPDFADAYRKLAKARLQQGELDEAIECYKQALQLRPNWPEVRNSLASLVLRKKLAEKVAEYIAILRRNPENAEAHYDLGAVFFQQRRIQDAVKHWTEALRLKPDWPEALNNLAWILATSEKEELRDPAEAVRLAERAAKLTGFENPGTLDTLSVAYAAAGRFTEAVQTAEKALNLAQHAGNEDLAKQIRGHLELFKNGQPFIETRRLPDE